MENLNNIEKSKKLKAKSQTKGKQPIAELAEWDCFSFLPYLCQIWDDL